MSIPGSPYRSYGTVLLGKSTPREERQPAKYKSYIMDIDHYNKTGEVRALTEPEEYTPPECTDWLPEESIETEEKEMTPKTLNKPIAEELRADQLVMNKLQAAKKYNCSKATIERWTKEYELPHWKQSWQRGAETQNTASEPSEGSPAIDSASEANSNDSGANMEVQRMHTIPVEPEVLEEISTLDDIPFAEEPTKKEISAETKSCETPTWWDLWSNGDLAEDTESEPGQELLANLNCSASEVVEKCELQVHLTNECANPDEPDEPDWQHIENEIKALYQIKKNRLNGEFRGRLRKILEGVGA